MALPAYGQGTLTINNPLSLVKKPVVINNPLRLQNTAAPKISAPAPTVKTASATQQATSNAGNTNTGGGGGTTTAAVDPWASTPWGSQAAHDQAVGDYNTLKNTTLGSITDSITSGANKQKSGILDYLDYYKQQQAGLDSKAVQNELAKRQGTRSVQEMIGHGVQSAGVALNNANATNSSAAEGIAKAYGEIGRQEQSGVNNQYEQGNSSIAEAQAQLGALTETQKRHFEENKVETVNGVVTSAVQQLGALNQAAANASLPDRIQIDAEKQRIANEAMAALIQLDQILSSGLASIKPADVNTNRAKAAALDTAGTAPEGQFSYTTQTPNAVANTGPFASTLPIFTYGG